MRYFMILLTLCLLFCGCAAEEPAAPTADQPTVPVETTPVTESPEPTESQPLPPDEIDLLIEDMTTEEKVGQLFLARCPEENALEDIRNYHLGGYILFGQDFQNETPESVRDTITHYQTVSRIPMLIAVDEEGGTVTRISRYEAFRSERFPSPRTLYNEGGLDAVLETEIEKCKLLRSLGVNVNMAPVCDISTDPDAFMYSRSLGLAPGDTGYVIAEMVQTMDDQKVGSVLKHFPGYGNNDDTHTAMAVDARSLEDLEYTDLAPFSAGADAGCDAILLSHTIVVTLDPALPASLSPVVHEYLRDEMDFDGVAITDDLVMGAISECYGVREAAVLAVLAGNDLLCSTEYVAQYEAVLEAVNNGRISQEVLNQAVRRILQWKTDLGLL